MVDVEIAAPRQALEEHDSPLALAIADALGRMTETDLDPDERAGIAAIEARRAALLEDNSFVAGSETLTVHDATRLASKKVREARLLFRLVRAIKPKVAIELGTNMGISGAYQALALKLDGDGRLITLEGHPGRAAVAQGTIEPYGNTEIRVGYFVDTLQPTLDELGQVDYAFIDGHHKKEPTLAYFEQILAHTRRPGVLLFDDIHHNPGMDEAWDIISADERVSFASDFRRIGVCLIEH